VSLADVTEPIPLTWIVRSGVVIGLVIIAAIALAIGAHCRGAEPGAKSAASGPPAESPSRVESGKPEGAKLEPGGKPEPSVAADPAGKPDSTGKPEPTSKPAPDADEPAARPEPARSPAVSPPKPAAPPKPTTGKARPGAGAGSSKKPAIR
jgi:hypothetical protein